MGDRQSENPREPPEGGICRGKQGVGRSGVSHLDTKCIFVSDGGDAPGHRRIHVWNSVSPAGGLSSPDRAAASEPRSPSRLPPKGPASSFMAATKTVPNRSPRPFERRPARPSSSTATLVIRL